MLKKVAEYLNQEYYSIKHYLDNPDSTIERISFIFLCFIYTVITTLKWILLFASCPIWIVPYLIYKGKKNGGKE